MWDEIRSRFGTFLKWAITSLIDSAFLAFWVLIQWLVSEYVIKPLQLTGIDRWVLLIAQLLFAVSTIVPIALYIYRDIAIEWIQTRREIQREREKSEQPGERNDPDQSP